MGSCASKCFPIPTKNDPSVVMQDKLVISESPPLTKSLSSDLPSTQTTSSSSSTCSLLSAASPAISSSNSSSSLSSSSSSATISPLPFSFSRAKSSTKENPCIVVLDPQKLGVVMKPKPAAKPSLQTLKPANPWKQSMAISSSQILAAKRARSSSPSLVSSRKILRSVSSSAVAFPSGNLSSSSTHQRIGKQRPEVGIAGDAVAPPPVTARKQTLQSCSPYHHTSSFKVKEANLHYIHQTRTEIRENSSRVPLIEELSNPLICMECFIFL